MYIAFLPRSGKYAIYISKLHSDKVFFYCTLPVIHNLLITVEGYGLQKRCHLKDRYDML